MLSTISITVEGKVQGVFFRQSVKEHAIFLGVTGEVENKPDGSVYITATGNEEQLNLLLAWCRKGPPRAKVTSVSTQSLPLMTYSGFNIIRH